jgi:DNA-binding transcriptional ArsR family regulator
MYIMNKPFDIFKALGEENRFRIMALLVRAGRELCACELMTSLGKPQYTISKSMSALVSTGIVEERRDGKMMMYRLKTEDPVVSSLSSMIANISSGRSYEWKSDFSLTPARSAVRCKD